MTKSTKSTFYIPCFIDGHGVESHDSDGDDYAGNESVTEENVDSELSSS